jgi:hypothetical protein
MFNFLRRSLPPYQTPLAMIGAKPGDRVLFFGTRDPGLVAEVALVTGLNGETSVIADVGTRPALESAAAKAGSLVEFLPDPPGVPFQLAPADIAVWEVALAELSEAERRSHAAAMFAALRPGGRLLIVDGGGSRKRLVGPQGSSSGKSVIALLTGTGAVAARALATVGHVTYYEARRP